MRQSWNIRGLSGSLPTMRWMSVFIFFLFTIIGGVMFYLFGAGISLRPATLIKPSEVVSSDQVAQAVVVRLFPEFQTKQWFIYQPLQPSEFSELFLEKLLKQVEATPAGTYQLQSPSEECKGRCVFIDHNPSTRNQFAQYFAPTLSHEDASFFTLQVVEFQGGEEVPQRCEKLRRLDEECIRALSIRSAQRKMKDPRKKYFFLKKYNHNQYYLFLQRTP